MKKILLVLMAIVAFVSFSQVAFADTALPSPASYRTSQESANAVISPNIATDIKLINYTPYVVGVINPKRMILDVYGKVEHIFHDTWAGPTRIVLWDEKSHLIFFDGEVWNHATVSITYGSRGYEVFVG